MSVFVRLRLSLACYCICALTAVLAGCAKAVDERIRFGLPTAPVTLDARFATDAVSDRLVRLLHQPLVDFDEHAQPIGKLANWQVMSPVHYRFVLTGGATFNSGRAVVAADVVATYRSILDPATGSPHRASLANIDTMTELNASTVDFFLHRADSLFPGTLVVGVMAAADVAVGRERDRWRESSGPFERVSWGVDNRVVLRRRSDGQLFEFIPVKDVTVRALKLISGELDIAQGNLPPEVFSWLAGHPQLQAQRVSGNTFSYLGFNLSDGITAHRNIRRAIAHAINREEIVRYVFDGAARPAAAIFPPEHWAGFDDLATASYDPAAARGLLAEAGYASKRIRLNYKTSSDYFRLRIATILQSQLREVGIDLNIQSLDWGTFYGDIQKGNFQIYGLSWVGLKLPDIFRYAFHSDSQPPQGANRGSYASESADAMIVAAESAGAIERRAIYRSLEQHLLYDLPYIPLWFEDQLVLSRRDIRGYATNTDGRFDALANTYRSSSREPR